MTLKKENILPCIEIASSRPAKYSLIWLHGLGADGNDFVPVAPELNLPSHSDIRFIFPHAPVIPITINHGYEMRAWYDIYALELNTKTDTDGIARSVASIEQLIEREVERGVKTNHIFLAGFSQGAAIALTTGIGYNKPLAGVIALSGYLPQAKETLSKANPANQHMPVFIAHGTLDPIVPLGLGLTANTLLTQAGYKVDWHSYLMPHSVCNEEIKDISQWLINMMGNG